MASCPTFAQHAPGYRDSCVVALLLQLSQRHGLGGVRGAGLLWALELGSDNAAEVVRACREQGLLVNAARPHCLRFMPRLNSTGDSVPGNVLIRILPCWSV